VNWETLLSDSAQLFLATFMYVFGARIVGHAVRMIGR
jgi:hypothetical protein